MFPDLRWLATAVVESVLLLACTGDGDGVFRDRGGDTGAACGNGVLEGAELCDDGNTGRGDGCDDTCLVEQDHHCDGEPSACTTVCGDGLVVGAETCDDGNADPGDGCSACQIEAGHGCTGEPSACTIVCGDGLILGAETCDDGNSSPGDGCHACRLEIGYYCQDEPSVCKLLCGDGLPLGTEACDDGNAISGDGCSACQIETGYSCVGAPSDCYPGCGDGVVLGGETCDDGNLSSGDGCSGTCQLEGSPCSGIAESELNDGPLWASGPLQEGVLACGRILPLGDSDYFFFRTTKRGDLIISTYNALGGNADCDQFVDTVIELYDIDGQTLIAANDDNGLLNAGTSLPSDCSTIDPRSHPSVHGIPPGRYYIKVFRRNNNNVIKAYNIGIHATSCGDGVVEWSEQCEGGPGCDASCHVLAPGPGESLWTAAPTPGCPTLPSSTMRLDVPSCFPTSGPIQWYSHVATDRVLAVSSDASGPIALFDHLGQEIQCSLDTTRSPAATFSTAGKTYYAAVSLPSSMKCLDFDDRPYSGLQGTLTDLNATFPPPPAGVSIPIKPGIAVSPTQIFVGRSARLYEVPKTGNAVAIERGLAAGITQTNTGDDLHFTNGSLFSLYSQSGSSLSTRPRVHRHYDGTTWTPTVWEVSPMYPTPHSQMIGVASDGSRLVSVMAGGLTAPINNPVRIYSYPVAAPEPAQLLASISPWTLMTANGIAMDGQYLYLAGKGPLGPGIGPRREGIYRFERANLSAPPVQIASYPVAKSSDGSHRHVGLALDDLVSPGFLYGRDADGNIHVIIDPAGSARHAGIISTLGTHQDRGLTFDPISRVIFFVESETDPNGRIVKLQ